MGTAAQHNNQSLNQRGLIEFAFPPVFCDVFFRSCFCFPTTKQMGTRCFLNDLSLHPWFMHGYLYRAFPHFFPFQCCLCIHQRFLCSQLFVSTNWQNVRYKHLFMTPPAQPLLCRWSHNAGGREPSRYDTASAMPGAGRGSSQEAQEATPYVRWRCGCSECALVHFSFSWFWIFAFPKSHFFHFVFLARFCFLLGQWFRLALDFSLGVSWILKCRVLDVEPPDPGHFFLIVSLPAHCFLAAEEPTKPSATENAAKDSSTVVQVFAIFFSDVFFQILFPLSSAGNQNQTKTKKR